MRWVDSTSKRDKPKGGLIQGDPSGRKTQFDDYKWKILQPVKYTSYQCATLIPMQPTSCSTTTWITLYAISEKTYTV